MLQIERHFKAVENVPPKNASECWIGKDTSLRGHDHSEGIVAQQCLFYLYATELKRWHTRDERSWRTPARLEAFEQAGGLPRRGQCVPGMARKRRHIRSRIQKHLKRRWT